MGRWWYFMRSVWLLSVQIGLLLWVSLGQAQTTSITSSGLGTTISPASIDPAGRPNYTITGGTRPGDGPNLFHSFGAFSVGTNNVARFFNESGRSTTNIFSRVTGGQTSNIYGTIQTAGFGTAALWLINPAGIVFGPSASLNVGGSVHFSTADYLRVGSGNDRFYADLGKTSQLTSAPVTAFGFLNSNPAAIAVKGSNMAVPNGQTLSLVGGNRTFPDPDNPSVSVPSGVTMTGGSLSTPGGRINIVSVASGGEVGLNNSNGPFASPTFTGFADFGRVSLSQGASVDTSTSRSINNPIAAGPIYIRAGKLEVDASTLKAVSRGYSIAQDPASGPDAIVDVQGGEISITAEQVSLTNQSTIQTGSASPPNPFVRGTWIDSSGAVRTVTPGTVTFNVGSVLVSNSLIDVGSLVFDEMGGSIRIMGLAGSGSEAGSVTLENSTVRVIPGGHNNSQTPPQSAGDIEIRSRDVLIDRLTYHGTTIDGMAGNFVVVSSGTIDLKNTIISSSSATDIGGDLILQAGEELNLVGTNLESHSLLYQRSGNIELTAPIITMQGGKVSTDANTGDLAKTAGNIVLSAEAVNIHALRTGSIIQPAQISSSTIPSGGVGGGPVHSSQAGTITLQGITGKGSSATHVVIDNSTIATTTMSPNSAALHPATITIAAKNIDLANGAQITASSTGTAPAGDIALTSGNNIVLENSQLSTSASQASGGNITLTSGNMVLLRDSQISTSVTGGAGSGGDIMIARQFEVLENNQILAQPTQFAVLRNSNILAQANQGSGGAIFLVAGVLLSDPASVINADSKNQTLNGTVNIQAPIQQLSGAIAPLPQAFAVATNLYGQRCATQKGGQFSSFVEGARDGVPPQPGDLIPSPLLLESEGISPSLASQSSPNLAAVRLGLPDFYHPAPVTFLLSTGCRS